MIYDINGVPLDCEGGSGSDVPHTDAQCRSSFMSYLDKKRTLLGMTGTHFENPHGMTESSYTTAQDLLKLTVAACGYRVGMDIWSSPAQSFSITGNNARTVTIQNNVRNAAEADVTDYKFLGGKGGSLIYSSGYHRAQVLTFEVDGRTVAVALTALGQSNYNNIYKSANEVLQMVQASMNGQTPTKGTYLTALVNGNGGFCGVPLPPQIGDYVNSFSPADLLTLPNAVYEGQTVSRYPASTTKTMTMICALDWITDLHKPFTVKSSDIFSGSGSTYYDGDTMTALDMLRIMMMESSNTLANAVARNVGGIILSH